MKMISECSVRVLVSATFIAIMTILQVPGGGCTVIGEATKDYAKKAEETGPLLNKLKGSTFFKIRNPKVFEKSERNSSNEATKPSKISSSQKVNFPVQLKNESTAALGLKMSASLKRRSVQETQCTDIGVSDTSDACKSHCGGTNFGYTSGSACTCYTSAGADCVYSTSSSNYDSGSITFNSYTGDSCSSLDDTGTYTLNECKYSSDSGEYEKATCNDNTFNLYWYTDSACTVFSTVGYYHVYGSVGECHEFSDLDMGDGSFRATCVNGGSSGDGGDGDSSGAMQSRIPGLLSLVTIFMVVLPISLANFK